MSLKMRGIYSAQHSPSMFVKEVIGVSPFPPRPVAADIWCVLNWMTQWLNVSRASLVQYYYIFL